MRQWPQWQCTMAAQHRRGTRCVLRARLGVCRRDLLRPLPEQKVQPCGYAMSRDKLVACWPLARMHVHSGKPCGLWPLWLQRYVSRYVSNINKVHRHTTGTSDPPCRVGWVEHEPPVTHCLLWAFAFVSCSDSCTGHWVTLLFVRFWSLPQSRQYSAVVCSDMNGVCHAVLSFKRRGRAGPEEDAG